MCLVGLILVQMEAVIIEVPTLQALRLRAKPWQLHKARHFVINEFDLYIDTGFFQWPNLASSPGTPRFYLAAVEKNQKKAWDQNYVTDQKWWTWLVCNVDLVS